MIDVNYVPIEQLPDNHWFKNLYQEASQKLKEWMQVYTVDWANERKKNLLPEDPKSREETPSMVSFPTTITYYGEEGNVSVTIYTAATPKKDGTKRYSERNYKFRGKENLNIKRDIEKIFFFFIVSPFCVSIPELARWQNRNRVPDPVYQLLNKEVAAKAIVGIEEVVTRAKSKIFGDFAVSDEKIRMIAGVFGIPNADTSNISEVKMALNALLFKQDKGKYNVEMISEFIELCKVDKESMSIGVLAQKAIDAKIIVKAAPDGRLRKQRGWYFADEDGKPTDFLCATPPQKKHNVALVDFLDANPEVTKTIEEILQVLKENVSNTE